MTKTEFQVMCPCAVLYGTEIGKNIAVLSLEKGEVLRIVEYKRNFVTFMSRVAVEYRSLCIFVDMSFFHPGNPNLCMLADEDLEYGIETIRFRKVLKETDLAFFLDTEVGSFWVRKSQIRSRISWMREGSEDATLAIPKWMAEREGWE